MRSMFAKNSLVGGCHWYLGSSVKLSGSIFYRQSYNWLHDDIIESLDSNRFLYFPLLDIRDVEVVHFVIVRILFSRALCVLDALLNLSEKKRNSCGCCVTSKNALQRSLYNGLPFQLFVIESHQLPMEH